MDLIVKKASALSTEEKSALGITGIPAEWPVESYPYAGTVPSGFIQMTDAELSSLKANNQAAYDAWVASRTQIIQAPVNTVAIAAMPDPSPFAQPTFRTKRNATATLVSVAPGGVGDIDYLLTQERYVTGGTLLVENAELGDYVTAEIEDIDGVIPSPYRAALCENWPTVAVYIEKEYVEVATPGSVQSGSVTLHRINTYPLNAKVSAGLYLCVKYHAVNSGTTRRIAVNYNLSKKL